MNIPQAKSKRELNHRRKKRIREISFTIETITNHLKANPEYEKDKTEILEFGCGEGFQIPYLKSIGNVVASDIYRNENIKGIEDLEFVECGIGKTPFENNRFDVIFSSQVIEHIEDLNEAFSELLRIGKSECIYAFTVPTSTWLLISFPIKYIGKLFKILNLMYEYTSKKKTDINVKTNSNDEKHTKRSIDKYSFINKISKVLKYLIFPGGHGAFGGFATCYKMFKIKNWEKMFIKNGFIILQTKPLLLYAPSEMPYIPTTTCFNKYNICSSVLFILKNK